MAARFGIGIRASLGLVILCSCGHSNLRYSAQDFAAVPKIDAHVHIHSEQTYLVEQARTDNFRLLTINVEYHEFPPLKEQRAISKKMSDQYRSRLSWATTPSLEGWEGPNWASKMIETLKRDLSDGAVAVKFWKNVGIDLRSQNGSRAMIDDKKFDTLFRFLIEQGVVVIGHQGEPKDCWLPLEKMVSKTNQNYFQSHPEYHLYNHPEVPGFEEQIAARDRRLENSTGLVFVGAHLASLDHDLELLRNFLERFPLAEVDLSARMESLMIQSQTRPGTVREFLVKYQDRILYGSDIFQTATLRDAQRFRNHVHEQWYRDWVFLATLDQQKVRHIEKPVDGLGLSKSIIDKIFFQNAARTFRRAWSESELNRDPMSVHPTKNR